MSLRLVDIHSHVLPGIDDGPDDLSASIAMARAAADTGVYTLAATPHLREDFPRVRVDNLAEASLHLQEALDSAGVELRIVVGAEVSVYWLLEASAEELRMATYGQAGTDLLVEAPNGAWLLGRLLEPVQAQGFRITLAHPERSAVFHQDPGRLVALTEQGVLLQVDADALLAPARSPVRRLTERLCQAGYVHAVASDGHSADSPRSVTVLAEAVGALEDLVGPERARWMVADAPDSILKGDPLPEAPEMPPSETGLLRRLFG